MKQAASFQERYLTLNSKHQNEVNGLLGTLLDRQTDEKEHVHRYLKHNIVDYRPEDELQEALIALQAIEPMTQQREQIAAQITCIYHLIATIADELVELREHLIRQFYLAFPDMKKEGD